MALIDAINYITASLDQRSHTIGVFLDLSKAFDTVNHNILLSKLYHYGIRGNAQLWFKSYLTDRVQCVKYNDELSAERAINIGVPQGSIMGPLLFIIYVNDLPNVVPKLKSILFADDTTLFSSGNDIIRVALELNTELDKLAKWFTSNKLSLNIKKTHYILFSLSSVIKNTQIDVKINENSIEKVSSTKFLGIYIDDKQNWVPHIDHVCKKLRKSIGILKKVKPLLTQKTLISLYYSLIYPYLTYCQLIWGKASCTHLKRITVLQKRAIRVICGVNFLAHTEPLFNKTKIIRFQELYNYLTIIFIYKLKNNLLPLSFRRQIRIELTDIPQQPTRSSAQQKINLPLCRTVMRQNTIMYQLYKIYNELFIPLEFNNINSLHQLKKM